MSTQWSRWRRAGGVLLAGATLMALAACSGGGAAPADASSASKGDITWWGWTPDKTNADKLIAAFNEEYPDIKVEFVSKPIDTYDSVLGPAITSSEGPDVFNVAPGSANGGVDTFQAGAIDLAPAVEGALGADWQTKLATSGVDGLMVGDKVVGLSAGAVYSGSVWINKDIFDKNGLTPPTNLDEWKSVCDALTAAGQGCFVQGAGQWAFDMDTFEAIMENVEPGAYVKATEGKMSFTDPVFLEGMEIWKQLFDDGIMQEGAVGLQQYPDANNEFMSGRYAMVMMGTWYTQYTVKDIMIAAMEAAGVSNPEPFTMIPIQFPDVANTGNVGNMFGDADYGLAVSAKSDQQAAATTFATWLATSDAGQQAVANTLNNIPSLKGIQPQWDQIDLVNADAQLDSLKELTEIASASTQPRFASVSADLNTAFRDALIGVATGDVTPDEALKNLQAVVDAG
ncbi:ABC transporter substrate-binding protein [Herbiconiux sp. CPCC 205763]|uniref:ABC transporter substrate-binding protein n=1 Tax=Herbiconiux aconitum TaxID=2970913 RepID=A0ABT2GMP6_9MICO|nr:ABC transporter substrate-binding protein [Herbiconiux aconitum]MCS5717505.1 ABC transporter substrate-binding protein [Herbiconiux aconitum]